MFVSAFYSVIIVVIEFYPVRPQKVSVSTVAVADLEFPKLTLCSPAYFSKQRWLGAGYKLHSYEYYIFNLLSDWFNMIWTIQMTLLPTTSSYHSRWTRCRPHSP